MNSQFEIREIQSDEYPFLHDMLREAIFFPDLSKKEEKLAELESVLDHYFDSFGERSGDIAFVLVTESGLSGAVWVRVYTDLNRSYGFVDGKTPELGIAIKDEWRNRGLGEQMINALLEKLSDESFDQVSLSVDKRNRAKALYERMGFCIFSETENSCTMVKTIRTP